MHTKRYSTVTINQSAHMLLQDEWKSKLKAFGVTRITFEFLEMRMILPMNVRRTLIVKHESEIFLFSFFAPTV